MDVPVALGIGAAFAASVAALLRGSGEVWFDSITMFIFLLLASRYLELSSRRRTAQALETLQYALPAVALRMAGYPASRDTELVPAARLNPGDVILVQPGQAAAADGVIVEGETEVDLALLTGESRPRRIGVGEPLPGGAVNAAQAVLLRVSRACALQHEGAVVAMVGDGVNDAAVLSGADVSFALGGGAALAQLHADCVLLGQGLAPLADAAAAARATLAVIRQNLAWAMVYNLVAIPAAGSGLLNPWLSGIGMAASSAVVVLNALRLHRGL